jgi:parallel beta-helix repeat protein
LVEAQGILSSPVPTPQCFNNCTHLTVTNGYLIQDDFPKKLFIGMNWSSIQRLLLKRLAPVGQLPGLDANASTMRYLTLNGDYLADVPLSLPSRLHFRLNGNVHGNLTASNQGPTGCKYGYKYFGRCALVLVEGQSFVSISGGNYTCDDGNTAFAISCEHCTNLLVQNLTASGCGQGNIHYFAAGPAIEIRNVESSNSNRGVWSQTPSQKVLITDSFFHHNSADGVDLDSMSLNVMVRNNRMENNHRCGIFVEEGASNNILIDNHFFNNTYGIGFYTNLGGKDPGKYPTKDNWVVGNTFVQNAGGAISLGGMKENGATDNFIAENKIHGNGNGWGCNGALVGNHVMTRVTTDPRSPRLGDVNYGPGNVTFFAEP